MTYTERNSEDRRKKSPRRAYDTNELATKLGYALDKKQRVRALLKQVDRELEEAIKVGNELLREMAGKKVA